MIENVILFRGRLETLDYFSEQMAQAFEMQGISAFIFDLKGKDEERNKITSLLEEKRGENTIALGFSFGGLSKEKAVYDEKNGYVWECYEIPFANVVCDHPYHFFKRLKALGNEGAKAAFLRANYHHISIDRNHQKFMERYFPSVDASIFLPLAGTSKMTREAIPPMEDREYPILFAGNYKEQNFVDTYLAQLKEEERVLLLSVMESLKNNTDLTVEKALLLELEKVNPKLTDSEFLSYLGKNVFLDFFVRNYYRGQVVKAIGDYGLPITIVGMGWEDLWEQVPDNVHLLPEASSEEVLGLMRQSKICLNVMPWFKDGAHDRIFNAILNHSVSFSDESVYIMEELKEGEGVFFYSLHDLEKMCVKLSELLAHTEQLTEAIETGFDKVKREHDWFCRAASIVEDYKKYNV